MERILMYLYPRYRVDKGTCSLMGKDVRVVGDYDWVEHAVQNASFSISKNRGVWRVYLPYTVLFDVLGASKENVYQNTQHFYDAAVQAFEQLNVKYFLSPDTDEYMRHYRARFGTWKKAERFAFLMQLQGHEYIPQKFVRTGLE